MRLLNPLTLLTMLSPLTLAAELPDIDAPLRTGASASNDAAVVIGNEDYIDVADVPYAAADADAFRNFLIYTRGVPQSQVQTLNDASPAEMQRAVERAAQEVGPGGVLWVYYAGHGAAHPTTRERVLLGRYAKLSPDPVIFGEGVIRVQDLKAAASVGTGEAVFIVDACYSGTGRSGEALGDGRFAVPTSYAAAPSASEWTATQPDQVASPLHAAGHGAFTYFAVGALRGWADGELDGRRDGEVSLKEAQAYVARVLREVGLRNQSPAVVGGDALALIYSGGLEAAPDLRDFTSASSGPVTSGMVVSSGDFVANLDVSAALAAKACDDAAEREARAQRSARMESEVRILEKKARVAWSTLGPQAEACLALDEPSRAPCISKVEEFITWAGELEVVFTEGFEAVQTDCGQRSVPMTAQRKSVAVRELEAAEAALAKLEGKGTDSAGTFGYEMVKLSPGRFMMGSSYGDDDETPHPVRISHSFSMGKTEVTQGLYKQVMGKNPSKFSSCGDSCPVEQVSWYDVVTFVNKLSELEGLEACYEINGENVSWPRGLSCKGYRLPTEAEWEYAARAGLSTTYSGSTNLSEVGWYKDNSDSKIHPVAQKRANAWGLYDMSGNVWEWTWDWYDAKYYQSSSDVDPVGPHGGSIRVVRGGSWLFKASYARVANRSNYGPSYRSVNLGFRLSKSTP